ncbi:glycosyltransferase [Algibacter lectus]|uniref:glycosyltransferase n=1 Tax=Algibacter lectus TaxID=221126 RepID=UPI0024950FE2|nr:glycosyltransferase [Algibacter lectus]
MDKKKICVVVNSLGSGGAERSSALLTKMLDNLGYNVHIVSVLKDVDYEYAGSLLNLGELKEKDNSIKGRLNRFFIFKNYLKENQFDFIIDNRVRQSIIIEFFTRRILYKNKNIIYVIRSRKITKYFTKSMFWGKRIFRNAYAYVGVSEEIRDEISNSYKFKNVIKINNPVEIDDNNSSTVEGIDFTEDYILFYGRLSDEVKNVSLLIDAYKISQLPEENIKLLILGDGKDKDMLKYKANSDNINFKPFTNNPFPYVKHARFCCLTSRYEGFPRVLIESLSVGTPVLSVECSGVSEIVVNEYNGLIVENNNKQALAGAMNKFVLNKDLYTTCKQNSRLSIEHLSLLKVGEEWSNLLNEKR